MENKRFKVIIEKTSGEIANSDFMCESIYSYYDFTQHKKGCEIISYKFLEAVAQKDIVRIKKAYDTEGQQKDLLKLLNTLKYMDHLGYLVNSDNYTECNMGVGIREGKAIIFIYNNLRKIYNSQELWQFVKDLDKIEVPAKISFE